jgi:capsule polysaccharide export protein KpsE/RkpR
MAIGNIQIIKLLVGKWKHFAIIAVAAAVVGAVVSMPVFMKPKYKSESVVYPTNLGPYSLESPTEQLMQLLQSRKLRMRLLRSQQLWRNYDLDTTDPQFEFFYGQLFEEHVKISQTKYESVIIEVFDHDPVKAKTINDAILNSVNEMVKQLHDQKTKEIMDMFTTQLNRKKRLIDSCNAQLTALREKYGILDYHIQAKEVSRSYYKALANGKTPQSVGPLMNELKNLEQKGGEYRVLDVMTHEELMEYIAIKKDYDNKLRDLNKKFSYTTIVAEPNKPVKKAWPVRWMVVLVFMLSSVFIACLYYIIVDRMKRIANA